MVSIGAWYNWELAPDLPDLKLSIKMRAHNSDLFILEIDFENYKEWAAIFSSSLILILAEGGTSGVSVVNLIASFTAPDLASALHSIGRPTGTLLLQGLTRTGASAIG